MAKYTGGLEDDLDLRIPSIKVLEKRYLKKEVFEDKSFKILETGSDMFKRVAYHIAKADKIYDPGANIDSLAENFYKRMTSFEFLPNSPTLMNADRELGQLSGCFVLPVYDSIESIFDTLKYAALVHKSGGGTGFSFSRLRPKNDSVKSTSGVSSGPVSFMEVYNKATEVIKQGGTRRGANMGILRVDHPDIMEFITCKDIEGLLNNFNISVAVTDKFMNALEKNEEYDLINPKNNQVIQKLKAIDVYNKIVEQAWKNGEPGVVFIDRINQYNPTPKLGEIESTNPCGEQPLLSYESCNLGSINLGKFVTKGKFDFDRLEVMVEDAVHFLDNVIDMNKFPLPEIEQMTKGNRKVGLGVMGFADTLIQMGISYNSKDALDMGEKIMEFIQNKAKDISEKIARQRGSFPNIDESIYKGKYMRNATLTTIAPTGTISVIANNASSGIEPLYQIAYLRNVGESIGSPLIEVNPGFERIAKENGFWSDDLIKVVENEKGMNIAVDYSKIPKNIKELFVTAHELPYEQHVKMQAAFQKQTDNAVSKTINFPENATKEHISKSYQLAYDLSCKGVTVYRDKSRDKQLLTTSLEKKVGKNLAENLKRPEVLSGETKRMRVGCGKLYVTKNMQDGKFREIFTACDFQSPCQKEYNDALCKAISLLGQHNVTEEEIGKTLLGGRCDKPCLDEYHNVSCPDAIGKVIMNWKPRSKGENSKEKKEETGDNPSNNYVLQTHYSQCPKCKMNFLKFEEGCEKCDNPECDYSKCG